MDRNPQDMIRNERLEFAISLAAQGVSQQDIAAQLGVSQPAVSKMLRGENRRLNAIIEANRTVRIAESQERLKIIPELEALIRLHLDAAKKDPENTRLANTIWNGLKLLAQLRGEFIDRQERRVSEDKEPEDIDIPYFEDLLKRFGDNSTGPPPGTEPLDNDNKKG